MTQQKRKVSVLLSEPEFQQLDRLCKAYGYKKSTLIARLIRSHLTETATNNSDGNGNPEILKQPQGNE